MARAHPLAERLAGQRFERVVYLGSNELRGLAFEAALKLLELTDGRTVAIGDSVLGFATARRPSSTDARWWSSSSRTTRTHAPMSGTCSPNCAAMPARAQCWPSVRAAIRAIQRSQRLEGVDGASDIEVALLSVLFAQIFALRQSLTLGLTPDRPNAAGVVNRVVQGVTIHPCPGTASMYLGVDGGGTKTAYALIDADGQLRARHSAGSVSHLSGGVGAAAALLRDGIGTVLAKGSLRPPTCRLHISDCQPTAKTAPRRRSWMRCHRRSSTRPIPLRKRHDLQAGPARSAVGTASA